MNARVTCPVSAAATTGPFVSVWPRVSAWAMTRASVVSRAALNIAYRVSQ